MAITSNTSASPGGSVGNAGFSSGTVGAGNINTAHPHRDASGNVNVNASVSINMTNSGSGLALPLPSPFPLGSMRVTDPTASSRSRLRRVEELVQRGRMILDVAGADLDVSEEAMGPFHPVTLSFRATLDEARRSWERLRAELGTPRMSAALDAPPRTVLTLGENHPRGPSAVLIVIGGQTYAVTRLAPAPPAPYIWRIQRLPLLEDGPYHACRLVDNSFQCDCPQWIYQIADTPLAETTVCKHLAALQSLGWLGAPTHPRDQPFPPTDPSTAPAPSRT